MLAPHHHIAFVDDRTVALDVGSDRYRLFGARETRALRALVASDDPVDEAALDALQTYGLLTPTGRPLDPVDFDLPVRGALETAAVGGQILSPLRVAKAVVRASFDLRFKGLRRSLEASARRDPSSPSSRFASYIDDERPLVDLVQSYAHQRQRVPITPVCLRDSIALRSILADEGYSTRLVIAVRLAPFAAHCWLQVGDLLLNDGCDNVSGYTPIFVL